MAMDRYEDVIVRAGWPLPDGYRIHGRNSGGDEIRRRRVARRDAEMAILHASVDIEIEASDWRIAAAQSDFIRRVRSKDRSGQPAQTHSSARRRARMAAPHGHGAGDSE